MSVEVVREDFVLELGRRVPGMSVVHVSPGGDYALGFVHGFWWSWGVGNGLTLSALGNTVFGSPPGGGAGFPVDAVVDCLLRLGSVRTAVGHGDWGGASLAHLDPGEWRLDVPLPRFHTWLADWPGPALDTDLVPVVGEAPDGGSMPLGAGWSDGEPDCDRCGVWLRHMRDLPRMSPSAGPQWVLSHPQ